MVSLRSGPTRGVADIDDESAIVRCCAFKALTKHWASSKSVAKGLDPTFSCRQTEPKFGESEYRVHGVKSGIGNS
jgi:hypothetical protein